MNHGEISQYIIFGSSIHGITQRISEIESELTIRNLLATYLHLISRNRIKTKLQLLEITIDIARAYYDKENPAIGAAFTKWWQVFDTEDLIVVIEESSDYLSLVSYLGKRADEFLDVVYMKNNGTRRIVNNEETEFPLSKYVIKDVSKSCPQIIHNWFKTYISTIGTTIPIQISRATRADFIKTIDLPTLFFNFKRLSNFVSLNHFELLLWIIEFGDLKGNKNAESFRNYIISDITGNNNIDQEISLIRSKYSTNYKIEKDPTIIDHYLKGRSYILANIIKGISEWIKSPNLYVESESEKLVANSLKSVDIQITRWKRQYKPSTDVSSIENLVGLIASNDSLEPAVQNNVFVLKTALGIDVSEETIRWLLINNALSHSGPRFFLSPNESVKHELFKTVIHSFCSKTNAQSLLVNIKLYANKSADIFSHDGIRSRLFLLARINAVFDESIIGV